MIMRTTFGILFIIILCSFEYLQKGFLKNVNVGKYSYSIFKESKYLHDEGWNAEYFVVYQAGAKRHTCSSFLKATRNDSIFVSGDYIVYKNRIEFIEHYYYNKGTNSTDSVKNIFYPNKAGNLILKQSIRFTQKQKIINNY